MQNRKMAAILLFTAILHTDLTQAIEICGIDDCNNNHSTGLSNGAKLGLAAGAIWLALKYFNEDDDSQLSNDQDHNTPFVPRNIDDSRDISEPDRVIDRGYGCSWGYESMGTCVR